MNHKSTFWEEEAEKEDDDDEERADGRMADGILHIMQHVVVICSDGVYTVYGRIGVWTCILNSLADNGGYDLVNGARARAYKAIRKR